MSGVITKVTIESLKITGLVFGMMVAVDLLNVITKGKLSQLIKGGRWRQYLISSLLGATPGCLGTFATISLYVHGLISFGALVGVMIATSGDEAFVMLAMFPKKALLLFGILFLLGVVFAFIADKLADRIGFIPCTECDLQQFHPHEASGGHYLREHIVKHIVGKHLWRVFLWTFGALLIIELGLNHWNIQGYLSTHTIHMLFIAALVGIIPESGPHLIFVTMYAKGLIPFSILLTSSIVQDGHGILPLLSYTVRDAAMVKLFNLGIGIGIGLILLAIGW
ncbi:MAG: arsenic efflux protein [Acidobacteria bacterium]|nr:arsenic efflux protein [Acidobacteriota bacterium]